MKYFILSSAILLSKSIAINDHNGLEFQGGGSQKKKSGRHLKDHYYQAESISPSDSTVNKNNYNAPQLLLSSRFSALNFDSNNNEHHSEEVKSSFWGRLYVEGFSSTFQYFRAHFGAAPSSNHGQPMKLILADPLTMCNDQNETILSSNDFINRSSSENIALVTKRGGFCTFANKTLLAEYHGAAAIAFVNNESGNLHVSGPAAHDSLTSAVMLSMNDGDALINTMISQSDTSRKALFIPMQCGRSISQSDSRSNSKTVKSSSSSYCKAIDPKEQHFIDSKLLYTGYIHLNNSKSPRKFIQAEFGNDIIDGERVQLVRWPVRNIDDNYACCEKALRHHDYRYIKGKGVIVQRGGGCSFAQKAEVLSKGGAKMMILVNNDTSVFRMGIDKSSSSHIASKITVSAVMVSNETGQILVSSIGDIYKSNTFNSKDDHDNHEEEERLQLLNDFRNDQAEALSWVDEILTLANSTSTIFGSDDTDDEGLFKKHNYTLASIMRPFGLDDIYRLETRRA